MHVVSTNFYAVVSRLKREVQIENPYTNINNCQQEFDCCPLNNGHCFFSFLAVNANKLKRQSIFQTIDSKTDIAYAVPKDEMITEIGILFDREICYSYEFICKE